MSKFKMSDENNDALQELIHLNDQNWTAENLREGLRNGKLF